MIGTQARVEVLSTGDSTHWDEALLETGGYDFHHTSAYHRLAEICGEGAARLIVFRDDGHTIAFPILVREGVLPSSGIAYRDATSVHGYAGPLASHGTGENVMHGFRQALQTYCESEGIVTLFSRLHPLLDQSPIVQGCGDIVDVGVTLSIDLTLPPEEQVAGYRKSNRYEIQRLRKMGFECVEGGSAYLADFIRIYHETMSQLAADPYYYYNREYFGYLLEDMADIMHLFICKDGDEVACVGLFSNCNGIIQYHLAGTASDYRRLAPMKLMLDTVREWGISADAKVFHLGGGVGAQRDSLYEFKKSFGSREHSFRGWKHVVDRESYEQLCSDACRQADLVPDDSYFPMYRHPALRECRAAG